MITSTYGFPFQFLVEFLRHLQFSFIESSRYFDLISQGKGSNL